MAVAVSLGEAGWTLVVFALVGVMTGGRGELDMAVVGHVRRYLPLEGTELVVARGVGTAVLFVARSVLILVRHCLQLRLSALSYLRCAFLRAETQ